MSYTGDSLIDYEADHWQDLAEKFIKKHQDEWGQFIYDEFSQHIADYEPPEHYKEEG